jgi:hypothetical protein
MPGAKRCGGDEEAGDGEKDLHSSLPIPKEEVELMRDVCGVGDAGEKQAHIHVVH